VYELIGVAFIIGIFSLISTVYRKNYRGLIVQSKEGRMILYKKVGKQYLAFQTRGFYKDSELFSYKSNKKKYIVDFWTLKLIEPTKEYQKLTMFEYLGMILKFKSFKRMYEDIDTFLLSSRKEYLDQGYYYSYGYKRFDQEQINSRIEKDISKVVERLITVNPENKKEYELIEKNYKKKSYKYILEMIPLLDLTGKKLFDVQVLSNNRNINMYQVIENYASLDYYSFIINNPVICSKKSRMLSDDIVNRHRIVHDLYKPYYTKENYLRIINLFTAMLEVKKSEYKD
jgi:hypothetical protein